MTIEGVVMDVHPRAGTLPDRAMLANIPRLMTAYYTTRPDPAQREQRVAFGTLGLNELEAFVKSGNARSHAALSSVGFRETGEQNGLKRVVAIAPQP